MYSLWIWIVRVKNFGWEFGSKVGNKFIIDIRNSG